MLLILFWVVVLMFNFSYLFSVLVLVFLIMLVMLIYMSGVIYLKYLVILVYVSGVVIFMLYISCMCWFVDDSFSKIFLLFGLFLIFMFDSGSYSKFSDVGEFLWMYMFFSIMFNLLVTVYSMNLYKISGSLRF